MLMFGMIVHIEKYHLTDNEPTTTIAWCGERATLHPDGRVDPENYDFVHNNHPAKATCFGCIAEHGARRQ